MNHNWGYCATDRYYKPADMLIRKLVECVSKGGNMLLNVGPDARGNIPPESLERLAAIGKWMRLNSRSVIGCGKAGIEKPDYGRVTRNGNRLYFHIYENTLGPLPLMGLKKDQNIHQLGPFGLPRDRLRRPGSRPGAARSRGYGD